MHNCQYDAKEIWELHEALVEIDMMMITYLRIVDMVKDIQVLPMKDAARFSDTTVTMIRRARPLLRQFDEIFLSQQDGKAWLVSASEEEVRLCRKRKVCLYNWVRLRPLMIELREDIMRYYKRVLYEQWEEPIETMGELKERWMKRLAPIVYPSSKTKKLRYIRANTMRYIRTCQDIALNDIGAPRDYAEKVMRGEDPSTLKIKEDG